MPTVKIIADSTCDLGEALLREHDIAVAPLYVTLGEKSYRDGVELHTDGLLAHFEKTREIPKTSATSVGDFAEMFRPFVAAGREIVFLSISSRMSAELQNARLAAAEFPGAVIRCVDGRSLSTGTGLLAIEAALRAKAGLSADRIADELEALAPKVSASFVLNSLTLLRHGGRCSGLTALGAAMLSIKPQISVLNGEMAPTRKFRGRIQGVARRYIARQLEDIERIRPDRVFLTYSTWPEDDLAELVQLVRARGYFGEIHTTRAGCVVTSHCGAGTIGILFLQK